MNKLDRIDPTELSTNPRATLAAWLKFEPLVLAAMSQHPKPYIYRPTNMAATSVCAKIRDAVRGKIAFDYMSEASTEDIKRWYAEVIFKTQGQDVYIGLPRAVKNVLNGEELNNSKSSSELTFPTLSFEEVSAFQLLVSNSRLRCSIKISQPPDLTLLPSRPNVQFIQNPDGSLVLL